MARQSWQESFFEKLVEKARETGDPRLLTASAHPRKKTASFEHGQLENVQCVFDTNRLNGNPNSQVLVVECATKRGTEIDAPALRQEYTVTGIGGELEIDGGVLFAQSRWGYNRDTAFPVDDPRQVNLLVGWVLAVLKLIFDHVERRRKLLARTSVSGAEAKADYTLALEQYLEDMLIGQWDSLPWGATLEYLDHQVVCGDLGRIDILARDRTTKDFVVIELKKDQSDDEVVGQLSRYMGWIKQHRADPASVKVRGIIVAHESTDKLRSAVSVLNGVEIYEYRLKVELRPIALSGQ